jgi:hypothetical protein
MVPNDPARIRREAISESHIERLETLASGGRTKPRCPAGDCRIKLRNWGTNGTRIIRSGNNTFIFRKIKLRPVFKKGPYIQLVGWRLRKLRRIIGKYFTVVAALLFNLGFLEGLQQVAGRLLSTKWSVITACTTSSVRRLGIWHSTQELAPAGIFESCADA